MTSNSLLTVGSSLLLTVALTAQDYGREKGNILAVAGKAGQFETLTAAVKAAGLQSALSGKGPFTVFAPTDEAFAKLGKETIQSLLKPENKNKLVSILTYHVVSGSYPAAKVVEAKSLMTLNGAVLPIEAGDSVMAGNAQVVKTDITASNGVIHVVDSVILPPDIVDTAARAGTFTTLLAAAKAAGLAEALKGDGPFTVFAPTDEAFAKLGDETIKSLLMPENKDKLAAILKFHVIPAKVMATDAVAAKSAKTLQGESVQITKSEDGVQVNGANVIATDIVASNGVIHVIDAVILPR